MNVYQDWKARWQQEARGLPAAEAITTRTTWGEERTYRTAARIPGGFRVWHIGRNMGHDEYIPVCIVRPDLSIIPESVLAVRMSKAEAGVLRDAAGKGIDCLETARRMAAGKPDGPRKAKLAALAALAASALEIFEKYAEAGKRGGGDPETAPQDTTRPTSTCNALAGDAGTKGEFHHDYE